MLENPCAAEKDFCVNCHSHFKAIRPLLKTVVVSRHFIRDLKDKEEVNPIVAFLIAQTSTSTNYTSLKRTLMETLPSEQRKMVSTYSTVWTRRDV